jgi:hypothetical protein
LLQILTLLCFPFMFSKSRFCCFLDVGEKDKCSPLPSDLKASTQNRHGTYQGFEALHAGECLANQTSLVGPSEVKNTDTLYSYSFRPRTDRSLCYNHTRENNSEETERYDSCLNAMPPHNGLLSTKKVASLSRQNSPRPLGLNPASAGSFVPEMLEVAHRGRLDSSGNRDEPDPRPPPMDLRPPPMEGWTEEDRSRFLVTLRSIGSPSGRRTGLGFHEWMAAVAEEVQSRGAYKACAMHALLAE